MKTLAQRMVDDYGLAYILEMSGISELDVIRILLNKGMIAPDVIMQSNPYRIEYGDEPE